LEHKPATIKDIAKALKVSVSTVARALKNHPDINAATKAKVLEAAEKLNYRPNILASGLRQSKTKTIGIIVPKVSNYFYSSAISGIEDLAYDSGYRVIICQSDESYEREVMNTRALLSNMVDGLLVAISKETRDIAHFREVLERKIPVVFFNRIPEGIDASKVYSDDYHGAYLATSHLIKSGCRKIAHLSGPQGLSLTQNRLQGYLDALQAHHIAIDEHLITGHGADREFGRKAVENLYATDNPPDGITAFNDWVAIGAMLALQEKGIRIPEDVAVFGFSNIPSASVISPALSTVDQSGFEVGKRAYEILLKHISEDEGEHKPEKMVIATNLILRNSTRAIG